ncbi:Uncharacterised protein [Mycobacteroides abscessus subsp. massiliense]|nr:Uncharacterised protein [Mycobacteroides abscessus subsp. massiliense]
MDSLLTTATLTVDGHCRDRLGQSRGQRRPACRIGALLTHLPHRAADHVVDQCRINTGAFDEFTNRMRVQINRMHARE